jgi:hypothetical protein
MRVSRLVATVLAPFARSSVRSRASMRASSSSLSLFLRSCSMARRRVFISWFATAAGPGEDAFQDPLCQVLQQRLHVAQLTVGLASGGPGRHPAALLGVLRGVGPTQAVLPRSGCLAGLPVSLGAAANDHQRLPSPGAEEEAAEHGDVPMRPGPSVRHRYRGIEASSATAEARRLVRAMGRVVIAKDVSPPPLRHRGEVLRGALLAAGVVGDLPPVSRSISPTWGWWDLMRLAQDAQRRTRVMPTPPAASGGTHACAPLAAFAATRELEHPDFFPQRGQSVDRRAWSGGHASPQCSFR